ncbi:MAG: purine-binding chemotaxis protein CheW [Desulfobulbaceae bacterium]|nr:purine-binding chemotaxis protein CheW [Desulfobulbaceae bacterium]MCK5403782.1 purine-binding chemotaxis protein CheW [Desulfobulbaceae bacterium]
MQQETDTPLTTGGRELALFHTGDLICGLDTCHVGEINKQTDITVVHRAPDYVRGVINLRGEIVTVIDLRKKFGFEPLAIDSEMRIVVVRLGDENIGLLVDKVTDVVNADPSDIEPPPSNLSGINGAFFNGIYKRKKHLVAILDIYEIMKKNEGDALPA